MPDLDNSHCDANQSARFRRPSSGSLASQAEARVARPCETQPKELPAAVTGLPDEGYSPTSSNDLLDPVVSDFAVPPREAAMPSTTRRISSAKCSTSSCSEQSQPREGPNSLVIARKQGPVLVVIVPRMLSTSAGNFRGCDGGRSCRNAVASASESRARYSHASP